MVPSGTKSRGSSAKNRRASPRPITPRRSGAPPAQHPGGGLSRAGRARLCRRQHARDRHPCTRLQARALCRVRQQERHPAGADRGHRGAHAASPGDGRNPRSRQPCRGAGALRHDGARRTHQPARGRDQSSGGCRSRPIERDGRHPGRHRPRAQPQGAHRSCGKGANLRPAGSWRPGRHRGRILFPPDRRPDVPPAARRRASAGRPRKSRNGRKPQPSWSSPCMHVSATMGNGRTRTSGRRDRRRTARSSPRRRPDTRPVDRES